MTTLAMTWADVPKVPAVYAMYGGEPPRTWVAYVGVAGELQGRLMQHFVRRDSSVVTQTSAVGVNIDHVSHVEWWESEKFVDEDHRHAAEMVAFDVLDPALRSRGNTRRAAHLLASDAAFRAAMEALFRGPPAGRFTPPRLTDVAAQLRQMEERITVLEEGLRDLRRTSDGSYLEG